MRTDLKWGTFRQRQDHGEIHVAPCYQDGLILEHHIVDVLCPCNPKVEDRDFSSGLLIVVHTEEE